jgi:hypothetical protein
MNTNDNSFTSKYIKRPLYAALALLLLLEEWLWDTLKRLVAQATTWLSRWSVWRAFEAWLTRLSPRTALFALLVPWLLLLPVKLLIVALLGKGRVVAGFSLAILTKLIGTAFVTRIFTLTKPALMQVAWFARLYERVTAWLTRAHAWVNGLPAVAQARARWREWKQSRHTI